MFTPGDGFEVVAAAKNVQCSVIDRDHAE